MRRARVAITSTTDRNMFRRQELGGNDGVFSAIADLTMIRMT